MRVYLVEVEMMLPAYGADPHRLALTLIRLLRADDGGQLFTNKYRERVCRAALLIDWAATGRLVDGVAAVELDTSRTGNPGADRLLAAIEGKPGRALQHWLSARVPVGNGLAQQLCDQGIWQPNKLGFRHAYHDQRADELAPLRLELEAVVEDHQHADPEIVALAMLSQLLALFPKIISPDLVNEYRCRQLTWIIRLVRDYFERELPKFIPGGNLWAPLPGGGS